MFGAWRKACLLLQFCVFSNRLNNLHSCQCHTCRVQTLMPAAVSLPCAWALAFWVACWRCCLTLFRLPLARLLWTLIQPLPMHSHLLLLPQTGTQTLTAARNTSYSAFCQLGRPCVSNCKANAAQYLLHVRRLSAPPLRPVSSKAIGNLPHLAHEQSG